MKQNRNNANEKKKNYNKYFIVKKNKQYFIIIDI